MERFYTIRFKRSTAKRFKQFSKKISKTYSESLDTIMNFFEWHGFVPSERFTKSVIQEILKNRQRTEANIAIMRNIEKNQTEPTTIMLQSLFEEKILEEEPEMIEKKFSDTIEEEKEIEITVPKIRYEKLHSKLVSVKNDFEYVLENVKEVKNNFGKPYFKLELTEGELEKFKRTIKNID
ncbi:MAG: hypothetical protein L3J20_10140 [Flavobacteriaceae bacterium]|nr:hypothetical protein [Flavobacteriaceae bacterium]